MPLGNKYFYSNILVDIFRENKHAFGGTEYMASEFKKRILPDMPKLNDYNCILIPGEVPPLDILLRAKKELIVWMHNTVYQFDKILIDNLFGAELRERIKYLIVVSEFQKQETIKYTGFDESKIIVIPNAIEPLKYDPAKFDNPSKIKLITTSTAERGTHVLLNAVKHIDADFRLEVYNDFNPMDYPGYIPDPRVRFYGRTPKPTVIEAVENSHIHSYPSIYPETFCLSQAEAMSAGLLCVTSDIGSLPEVSKGYTRIYPYEDNWEKHMKVYAEHLTKAIDDVRAGNWNPEEQIKFANSEYSWDKAKENWLAFHEKL